MTKSKIYEALVAKCQAERIEALATLDVYMSNPVGIGEHPQFIEEMDKQLEKMSNAEEKLTTLNKHFNNTQI